MISTANWLGVDNSHIEPIDAQHGLVADAKNAFFAMQHAALGDGIDLQLVSSFRSFERQLHLWQRKWDGLAPLYARNGRRLHTESLSEQQKLEAIMTWSALPGASRHHWGTDLDVYDRASVKRCGAEFELVDAEYQAGGPCYALNQWLSQHAQEFGFYRPYQYDTGGVAPEAWHLSYHPIAKHIIAQLNVEALKHQLEKTSIGGKDMIIPQLQQLFAQYTLNGEQP